MPVRTPLLLALLISASAHAATEPLDSAGQIPDDQYHNALAGEWRSAENRLRDPGRRPMETLRFFDLSASQTVIEVSPGDGWYSEILAPLLRDKGEYKMALTRGEDTPLRSKVAEGGQPFDRTKVTDFDTKTPQLGQAQSADLVVSFDDAQDWASTGNEIAMYEAVYKVLKPGGKFGLIAYRAESGAKPESAEETGYLPTDHVIQKAKDAGFVLATQEQMHSNPEDDRDRPAEQPGQEKADHQEVGEPDRMTLLFVKPTEPRP